MLSRFSLKLRQPLNQLSKSIRLNGLSLSVRSMSSTPNYDFSTLKVSSPSEYVKHVELNRPEKRNAMNTAFWTEIQDCFNSLAVDEDCRAIVLSGAGKLFTAGLDLQGNDVFTNLMSDTDVGRKAFFMFKKIKHLQESFNVIEQCPKPVIAAVHSGCVGGGIDMICACDIRYCTQDAWFSIRCSKPVIAAVHGACLGAGIDMICACDIRLSTQDAWFSIREIELGLAADLGTLQRFQKITGNDSLTRELTYTARNFHSDEAKSFGLVSRIFLNKEEMLKGALEMANIIASKSPIAVQASKQVMVYSRDHSVSEGLEYQCQMNSSLLQSEDVMKAAMGMMNKEKPVFSKL